MNLSKNYFSSIVFILTIISISCLSAVEPLYKYYLKMYDDLSTEKLEELRKFWKSDKFESKLSEDKVVDQLIEFADHLKNRYDSSQKIYALGQSPAYLVLTAALLEALSKNGHPNRYGFIAISGSEGRSQTSGENDMRIHEGYLIFPSFDIYKTKLGNYADYLKNINFIVSQPTAAIIAEQAETGISIAFFELILEEVKKLNLLKKNEFIPSIKWYIHASKSYDELAKNPTTLAFPEKYYSEEDLKKLKPLYSFTFNVLGEKYNKYLVSSDTKYVEREYAIDYFKKGGKDLTDEELEKMKFIWTTEEFKKLKPQTRERFIREFEQRENEKENNMVFTNSVIKAIPEFDFARSIGDYPDYPSELNATKNEKLRLVASFKPKNWGEIDPQKFVPDKEADMLVLRIIDRIKQTQHGIESNSAEEKNDVNFFAQALYSVNKK